MLAQLRPSTKSNGVSTLDILDLFHFQLSVHFTLDHLQHSVESKITSRVYQNNFCNFLFSFSMQISYTQSLTCSWRFLISVKSEQLQINWKKTIGIQKHAGKVIFLLTRINFKKNIKSYLYVISKSPLILSDSTQNLADKSTKNNIFVQKKMQRRIG